MTALANRTETDPESENPATDVSTSDSPRRTRLALIAAALAVVFAGLAGWFAVAASAAVGDTDTANTALSDTAATQQVRTQVSTALGEVFSYRYDDPDTTARAAAQVLTGAARGQYDGLFAAVRAQAPAQKLVLHSAVVSSGVRVIDGDRASLLVFVDQNATRQDTGASSVGAAQLDVTAQRIGGGWKIAGLRAG